jgi:hypothetical protein
MNQTMSAVVLPTVVMYLIMLLGFLRRGMLRRKRRESMAYSKMIDPVEMSLAAMILDLAGIVSLFYGLPSSLSLNKEVVTTLPAAVGILLFIIHLQLYAYVLRYRLDELEPVVESRRYLVDLSLSMLAILSNAMTVLAVLG